MTSGVVGIVDGIEANIEEVTAGVGVAGGGVYI